MTSVLASLGKSSGKRGCVFFDGVFFLAASSRPLNLPTIVPMRFFNLTLTPAEAEAYCADYLEEKSLRAGVARVLLRLVAVTARLITELEELKRANNSPSLWKLHADSLVTLLEIAGNAGENSERVSNLASQRGHRQQVEEIQTSLKKLRDYGGIAERTLTGSAEAKSAAAGAD